MCAHYKLRSIDLARIAMGAVIGPGFEEFSEHPRFDFYPRQRVPLVKINEAGERVMGMASWGFIPYWSKAEPKTRPFNSRAETVATNGIFRDAFARRRCILPATGFFEPKRVAGERSTPYRIEYDDERVFGIAAIWERWKPAPDSLAIETCSVVTTAPNQIVAPIHNRMPLILSPADYTRWLDPTSSGDSVHDLLRPAPDDRLIAREAQPAIQAHR